MSFFPPLSLQPMIFKFFTLQRSSQSWIYLLLGMVLGGMIGFTPQRVFALSPETAPPELTTLLAEIETAANRQDIDEVMEFYSSDFTHSDGFNRDSLEQVLTRFWDDFSDVNYEMELESWEQEGSTLIITTVTRITGTQDLNDRQFQLEATITSEQRIENQQIIQQDILAESNQLASGSEPPTVTLNVPETVKPGEEFSVDAIVEEPLDNDILLGAAIEQPVDTSRYFSPETIQMELLNTGGLFKVGEAPPIPENQWISAILMRQGGIVNITQRVRVINDSP